MLDIRHSVICGVDLLTVPNSQASTRPFCSTNRDSFAPGVRRARNVALMYDLRSATRVSVDEEEIVF